MKRSVSYHIALSGIACALSTVFLLLGLWVPPLLAGGYLCACFALMIPLAKNYYVGYVCAAIGSVLLACLFGGFAFFWKILPFAAFIAWHPLVNRLQRRRKTRFAWAWWLLKAAWFIGMLFLAYFFTFGMNVNIEWVDRYYVPVILVGGALFFIVYDGVIVLCQRSVDAIVKRIGR